MGHQRIETVVASLVQRGIPEMWATEDEAAALSGMHGQTFERRRADLEAAGFPKREAFNGKRFIPAILDFWRKRAQAEAADITAEEERNKENWNGYSQGGRQLAG